tara:strand:+ start:1591 stop:3360 length:1770 start_codon:yes stop_codon:yes gene_type:complete
MGVNKIPLALKFDDTTGNPQGLAEFTLNLSDVGDVCTAVPSAGQVLAFSGTSWCASTIVTGGGGSTFTCADLSACHPSSLSGICSDPPTPGQALIFNGTEYCPSTLNFISNAGAGNVTVNPKLIMTQVPTANGSNVITETTGDSRYATAAQGNTADAAIPNQSGSVGDILVIPEGGSNFSGKVASGTLFDEGIADKNIVVDGDLAAYAAKGSSNTFTEANSFGVATTNIDTNGILKLTNVEDNSLIITDSASAVSSVSGVSGSLVYFSGTGPKPVITGIPTIMQEASVRVEDKTLADLSDAQYSGDTPTNGQALIWQGDAAGNWQNQSVKSLVGSIQSSQQANGTTIIKNVPSVPPGKTGDGDITANTLLFFSGTDASSTDTLTLSTDGRNLIESGSATNVSANDIDLVNGSITTAPTTGNHIANKTYVDGVNNTQHNRLFAVGTKTDSIANVGVYLGWEFDAVSALSLSDSGGVITIGGTDNTEITFGAAGDYMIDCTARANCDNRVELFVKAEVKRSGASKWTTYNRLQNSNYAARDTDQNTGGTTLSMLVSMDSEDKIRFEAEGDADGTAVLLVNGTFLRIVRFPS